MIWGQRLKRVFGIHVNRCLHCGGAVGKRTRPAQGGPRGSCDDGAAYSSGTIISATMLMILISGFTAGPAVSL
jgi:hypothetical protein